MTAYLCSEEIAIEKEFGTVRETVATEIETVRLIGDGTGTESEMREGTEANTDVQRGAGVRTASAADVSLSVLEIESVIGTETGIEKGTPETPGRHGRRAKGESKDYRIASGSCTGDEISPSFSYHYFPTT